MVTPWTFVNDLFTEITHDAQVIPDTESVTVLISANAAVAKKVVEMNSTQSSRVSRFMISYRQSLPSGASTDAGNHAAAGCGASPTGRPTLRIASMNSRGRPHNELKKIAVTLTAIATIAHTG